MPAPPSVRPVRVAVPPGLPDAQRRAILAASPRVVLDELSVERPLPIRAARAAALRWLPGRVYADLRPHLDGGPRALRLDGARVERAAGVEVLFASWALDAPAVRRALAALPDLRWIHSASTGVDRFDLPALRSRGVALTAPVGVHARRIAEFALATVLADAKGLLGGGRGTPRPPPAPLPVAGRTLALLGFGAIGQALARLALPLGLEPRALVRAPGRASPVPGVLTSTDLEEVLRGAHVAVLALPLTPATRGMVGRRGLALLAPGALLVNVGRAGTLVEADLLAALRTGALRQACLDVLDDHDEVPRRHPALSTPGLLYTGHRAGAGPGAGAEVVAAFAADLARYCAGQPLRDRADGASDPSTPAAATPHPEANP